MVVVLFFPLSSSPVAPDPSPELILFGDLGVVVELQFGVTNPHSATPFSAHTALNPWILKQKTRRGICYIFNIIIIYSIQDLVINCVLYV